MLYGFGSHHGTHIGSAGRVADIACASSTKALCCASERCGCAVRKRSSGSVRGSGGVSAQAGRQKAANMAGNNFL